jgi:hypothetical protein
MRQSGQKLMPTQHCSKLGSLLQRVVGGRTQSRLNREIYAFAYAYMLRQLKYPETNKAVALALLREIVRALKATY